MLNLLIPPPLVLLVLAILTWFFAGQLPQLAFDFPFRINLAIGLGLAALVIDLYSLRLFVKSRTTVSPITPEKTERIVMDGVYRYTRNPMYLGLGGLLTSVGLWLGNAIFLAALVVFVWYITRFQIMPEEAMLRKKFGAEYDEYCRRVRRWI